MIWHNGNMRTVSIDHVASLLSYKMETMREELIYYVLDLLVTHLVFNMDAKIVKVCILCKYLFVNLL